MSEPKNKLYYGDNLQVLRDYIADRTVNLIYLDPPFDSRQNYNVLFAEKDGSRSVGVEPRSRASRHAQLTTRIFITEPPRRTRGLCR